MLQQYNLVQQSKKVKKMNRKKSQNIQRKSHHLLRYEKINKIKQLGFTTNWNVNDQKKDYDALQDPHANRYFRYQSVKMHIKQLRRSLGKDEDIKESQKRKISQLIKQKLSTHLPAIVIAAQTYNIAKEQLQKQPINKMKASKSLAKDKSNTEIDINNLKKRKSKAKKKINTQKHYLNVSVQPVSQSLSKNQSSSHQQQSNHQQQKTVLDKNSQKSISSSRKTENKNILQVKGGESSKNIMGNKNQVQKKQYAKKQQQLLHKKKHQEFIQFIAKKKELLTNLQQQ